MQKPTVGRQVHYFGPTLWALNVASMGLDADERAKASAFQGPYAATVVRVNDDGTLNLNVLWPAKAYGTDRSSEIAEKVEAVGPQVRGWDWPPRV